MKDSLKKVLTKIFIKQARAILVKYKPKVVVVVGSVGKTSTKLAIAKVLSNNFRVQYEEGNYNVPLSVPFVVTGQRLPSLYSLTGWLKSWRKGQQILKDGYNYDVVVLEYGVDHIGEMMEFSEICQPDIAVLTAISPEHMEYFQSIENVAKEELAVTKFTQNLLINSDTTYLKYVRMFANETTDIQYYGLTQSDYVIESTTNNLGFLDIKVADNSGNVICQTPTQMLGNHSLSSVAVASIIAKQFGMQQSEIDQAVSKYNNPSGRMSILKGKNNSTIIDDTYNASPVATIAGLKTLYEMPATKKIALLGNMNELGDYSKQAHQEVGQFCDKQKLDLVITLGVDANNYLAETAEANGCKVARTTSPLQAGKLILDELTDDTLVFAKGSQNGVYAEEAVKLLLADSADSQKLVRQNKQWISKKNNQFPGVV